MSLSQQLSAMIFELRSAGSPLAKAKALARAWRMIRRLSPVDRKLLVEEAGFEGAEDLLESLAAKRGGVAPALMLRLLNSVRERGNEGLGELMAGLRDSESREEMLMRGVEAVAEAFGPEEAEEEEAPGGDQGASTNTVAVEQEAGVPEEAPPPPIGADDETEAVAQPAVEPIGIDDGAPGSDRAAVEKPPLVGEEQQERPPMAQPAGPSQTERPAGPGTVDVASVVEALEAEGSLLTRLMRLREAIPGLGGADAAAIGHLVDAFPQGWTRRRALTALLEAGMPLDAADALDLIERLQRPIDRWWCLGVLADRGDLRGAEVARALEMVESPALHRRIRWAWGLPASEPR